MTTLWVFETSSHLWLFVVSYGHVTAIHDVFAEKHCLSQFLA